MVLCYGKGGQGFLELREGPLSGDGFRCVVVSLWEDIKP